MKHFAGKRFLKTPPSSAPGVARCTASKPGFRAARSFRNVRGTARAARPGKRRPSSPFVCRAFLTAALLPADFFRTAVFPASAAAFRRNLRDGSCRNGQPASLHGSRSLRTFQEPCRSKKAVPQGTARSIKKRPEKRGVESFAAHVPKRRKQGPKGAGRKDILPVMHGARGPGSYLW